MRIHETISLSSNEKISNVFREEIIRFLKSEERPGQRAGDPDFYINITPVDNKSFVINLTKETDIQ